MTLKCVCVCVLVLYSHVCVVDPLCESLGRLDKAGGTLVSVCIFSGLSLVFAAHCNSRSEAGMGSICFWKADKRLCQNGRQRPGWGVVIHVVERLARSVTSQKQFRKVLKVNLKIKFNP